MQNDTKLIYVNGKAYDIKDYVCKHPGGEDLITLGIDREATGLIYSYHPDPDKAFHVLKSKEIKTDKAIPCPHKEFETDFYRTIKQRANDYFAHSGKPRRGVLGLKTFFIISMAIIAYLLALFVSPWFSPLVGFLISVIGFCIHHDSNHGALSKSARLNHLFGLSGDLVGTASLVWRYQHQTSHHLYCNDFEKDSDVSAGFPLLRFSPQQKYRWYMRFQYIYALPIYAFIGVVYPLTTGRDFVFKRHNKTEIKNITARDHFEFWSMKLIYLLYMFVIPFAVLGWAFIYKFYFPCLLTGGLYLGTLFAVNHNNTKVAAGMKIPTKDWAKLQVLTSGNWSSKSKFWNFISGGLNCQIEHHLFPGICHLHYPELHKIVAQTCAEFNVPYHDFPTFRSILWDHLIFLKNLGKQTETKCQDQHEAA